MLKYVKNKEEIKEEQEEKEGQAAVAIAMAPLEIELSNPPSSSEAGARGAPLQPSVEEAQPSPAVSNRTAEGPFSPQNAGQYNISESVNLSRYSCPGNNQGGEQVIQA